MPLGRDTDDCDLQGLPELDRGYWQCSYGACFDNGSDLYDYGEID